MPQQVFSRLQRGSLTVQPLACFEKVINLLVEPAGSDDPGVIALVQPVIGDGPFHVVLGRLPPAIVRSPTRAASHEMHWQLLMTVSTRLWNPRPDWERITVSEAAFRALCQLVADQHQASDSRSPVNHAMTAALTESRRILAAALHSEMALESGGHAKLREAVARLAGLGIGLTPTGDDILAGMLLALRAAHWNTCGALGDTIYAAAAPRTHHLSRAFLQAARQGFADAKWHRLLRALSGPPDTDLSQAIWEITACGATSGLDMLNGFIEGFQALRRCM